MDVLTKSEFAASRGWSKPYVSKLVKLGRLVLTPDGRVDVTATDALLAETADPSKGGVTLRHEQERIAKGVTSHIKAGAALTEPVESVTGKPDFQKARAHREHYLSLLAEDEFLKGRGELVERKAVDRAAFAAARTLRDRILGLPPKAAGELIAITDTWEMERRLTELLRGVLEDADSLVQLDAELEQGAKEPN